MEAKPVNTQVGTQRVPTWVFTGFAVHCVIPMCNTFYYC